MKESVSIIAISILTGLFIAVYGTFRCKQPNFHDPLTMCMLPAPWDKFVDGWGFSHLMYNMTLAYMFPKKLVLIFFMGVLWEFLESLAHDHPFYLSGCNYTIDTDKTAGWWYGRWQDIVMNSIGICNGYYIYMKKKKQPKL